jgi:hypothetical protein
MHGGPRRPVGVAAVGVALGVCAWAALTFGPAAADPRADGWRTYRDESRGLAVGLPPGWYVAPRRLVPALINPREILSMGTGRLPVGGGGNCGRYPEAALERMRLGDRLISVQGSGGPPAAAWFRREDRWTHGFELGPLREPAIRRRPHGPPIRASATYVRRDGHSYWVFVAFAGSATPAAREQAERIVGGIRISG